MGLKLSMLAAAAVIAVPMAAGAQSSYGSSSAPKAQTDTQEGLTPAQAASKKSAVRKKTKTEAQGQADAQTQAGAATATTAQPAVPAQSTAPGQTGTTPGQMQTTPGEASELTPAVTGTTPSGQTTAKGQATATARVDVKAGASVFDSTGTSVGKIESVAGNHAVLDTGTVKVRIPLSSLATGDKGVTIGMSKAEIEAAAKAKTK